jgi:hypothetical protein
MNPQTNNAGTPAAETSSTGALVIAWLFVGIPLAWGVSQTFIKALTLFR